jgi:hypothetical protein
MPLYDDTEFIKKLSLLSPLEEETKEELLKPVIIKGTGGDYDKWTPEFNEETTELVTNESDELFIDGKRVLIVGSGIDDNFKFRLDKLTELLANDKSNLPVIISPENDPCFISDQEVGTLLKWDNFIKEESFRPSGNVLSLQEYSGNRKERRKKRTLDKRKRKHDKS